MSQYKLCLAHVFQVYLPCYLLHIAYNKLYKCIIGRPTFKLISYLTLMAMSGLIHHRKIYIWLLQQQTRFLSHSMTRTTCSGKLTLLNRRIIMENGSNTHYRCESAPIKTLRNLIQLDEKIKYFMISLNNNRLFTVFKIMMTLKSLVGLGTPSIFSICP